MNKDKLFAPFLMLFAAAIASIIMFRGNYDTTELLAILLCVMIFFYILGSLIQKRVLSFMNQIAEKEAAEAAEAAAEGEVVEKEAVAEEAVEGADNTEE